MHSGINIYTWCAMYACLLFWNLLVILQSSITMSIVGSMDIISFGLYYTAVEALISPRPWNRHIIQGLLFE